MELNNDLLNALRIKFIIKKGLYIGNHVRISWEEQLFDSNFQYIHNRATGTIPPIHKEIRIGDYVGIGNRVTLNKGTNISNHSIVESNSLFNKDYAKEEKEYITIAGSSAKDVAEGYERIFESVEYKLCFELAIKNKS